LGERELLRITYSRDCGCSSGLRPRTFGGTAVRGQSPLLQLSCFYVNINNHRLLNKEHRLHSTLIMRTQLFTSTRSALAHCRRAGVRQSIIGLMLTSWLFTLTLCAFGVDAHAAEPSVHTASPTHQHEHEQPAPHGGSDTDDLCCDLLQAQAVPTDAGAVPSPTFKFLHNIVPTTAQLTTIQSPVVTHYHFTHPPDNTGPSTRIANFLWPNAPPRHLA